MARPVLALLLAAACSGGDGGGGAKKNQTTPTELPPAACESGTAAVRGSDAYATVDEALAAAQAGDEVRICAGQWSVDGAVGAPTVQIVGDTGTASDVVLSPASSGTVLRFFTSESITLAHLTFQNATASAVTISSVEELRIEGCVFRDNAGDLGGGALSAQIAGNPNIPWNLDIRDSVFERNTAPQGGALELLASGDANLRIEGTTFVDNEASSTFGGGVYLLPTSGLSNRLVVERSEFTANHAATDGGALAMTGPGDLEVNDTIATANTADSTGGAYSMLPPMTPDPSRAFLSGGRIAANVAGNVLSGAVHLQPGWVMEVDDTDFATDPDDNVPKDVNVCADRYDGPATFTVGPGGCG